MRSTRDQALVTWDEGPQRIARRCQVNKNAVPRCIRRAEVARLALDGGVPRVVTRNNLKAAEPKAHPYMNPISTSACTELAGPYGFAVVPARARSRRDKALVENAVQIVDRELLAPLRDRTFFSLREANAVVRNRLDALIHRPFTGGPGSRRECFEAIERRVLPVQPSNRLSGGVSGSIPTSTSSMPATSALPRIG